MSPSYEEAVKQLLDLWLLGARVEAASSLWIVVADHFDKGDEAREVAIDEGDEA